LTRFRQQVEVRRHSPVALVDVRFEDHVVPLGDPWESYYASRLVWSQTDSDMRHGAGWIAQNAQGARLESPDWIEVCSSGNATQTVTLFPLGLPYHRRVSLRAIDTLLITAGETANQFRFAIGLNCAYPQQTSLDLLTCDADCVTNSAEMPPAASGWFFHVSARNVLITNWELLPEYGVRLRLLETEGRSASARLTCFRPFVTGQLTDFCEQALEELPVDEGRLVVAMRPYQWLQLEGTWK
jgi:hypothetical protein